MTYRDDCQMFLNAAQEEFNQHAQRDNLYKARTVIANLPDDQSAVRALLGNAMNIAERRKQIAELDAIDDE
ncbi:hypothetical protein GO986_09200 [Deinococcus sp. HMF7620]|uniref:Uncharacterized protein n=1 Tax=Deinococcus arboris TaxID=2682977 RepID=A0A7C9LQX3_9DEIO|nr:hypothetical protein [Deinococcus arboris]MVN86941.1 hypothetical protein [Deinococcus arboris]